ncbi:hypothetical protein A9798_16160 [Edwardsiella hoshinae]|uniref:Uncharacterized protein n=1 Tax=Edwardsiella hoshinae TaxID=93378 RepID=A0A376DNT8_9GAMM|nr:hypothetical protein [Edwardsiella hoshinae]AOV98327.1 hypothetical protein A9798_16160 [Edwardsiella hoshinae]QPR28820.1 hypothetical protein I6G97_04165 [Edwardsiella hoshinae]STC92102.1 Uncharacterised protein [Edwardsiella hoshinae]
MHIVGLTPRLLSTRYINNALAAQALVRQTDFSLRDGTVSVMEGMACGYGQLRRQAAYRL